LVVSQIYGASVLIRGELCAVLQFLFTDTLRRQARFDAICDVLPRRCGFLVPYTMRGPSDHGMASISVGGVYTSMRCAPMN